MSIRRAERMSIAQALAMTVAEIPMFLYSTFGQSIFSQLKLSPSLKKVLFATALGSVALALTAHHMKRRGRKQKQAKVEPKQVGIPEVLLRLGRPSSLKRGGPIPGRQMTSPSTRSNDTMSSISSLAPSKHSRSSHSIASQPNVWEASQSFDGMELFEEALQKWEQALNIRHRSHSSASNASTSLALEGETACPDLPTVFAEKLETLLHRAYHLQEDFSTNIPPDSLLADFESEGTLILPNLASRMCEDDTTTITSDDSFFSAAELFDQLSLDEVYQPLRPAALYDEAVSLVQDGSVPCRALRPKAFLEAYEDMLLYTQREETWLVSKMELEGRGVVVMNFFDIVLDFILMDAFEDLESPPSSVVAVLRNRWLSDSFKETALATACWSVLKAKRRLLMVPDGFISHFYAISEHVSPVLAFGFLGPRQHLSEVCTIFKQQIVQYLKDMFDHDKVRFTSAQSLAEDLLSLSHRRSDILLGYLGIDSLLEPNGALPQGDAAAGPGRSNHH
ncbi:unnamed protein product [Coregonus sp. 'balchen']|nr:unnamed protein product [Coregonus sp. 'balchen']